MAAQKQSLPSFAFILCVLSIVFYCAGFLRVELELNEQKKRINTLESIAEIKPSSDIPDLEKLTKNAQGFETIKFHRNKRQADSVKNTTDAKSSADMPSIQKINKLLSELKPHLCHAKGDTCPPGPPGPRGPRGEKGSRGRRGQKGRTENKGDRGIMGSPGKSGKQGIMGPVGPKGHAGLKGQKGDLGPAGMPGAKGEPGESISAPIVAVSPKKLTVNEGGSASFQCSVSGNPKPAIVWSKLDKQSTISQSAVLRGKLLLKNVAGSDSGTFNCSAANILGQAQALVQLVVNVRPRVSLHPGPHHAIEGSSFTLPTCHVTGYPAPVVTWRKSSGQLPQGRVKFNNSGLQILHVRKDDSDLYFCSAANLLGRVEKKTFLVVVSPPRFTVKPPAKVLAEVGETLRLNCSATGDPQPVISWRKQGGQLPVARSQQINGGFVIRDLTKNDKGNYICVATNAGVFKAETVTYTDVDTLGSSIILGSLDSKYRAKLNSYLDPVLQSSGRSRFVRCWHAKTDGWAASTFHSNCDGNGPTVTIVQVGSYIFGGYTDKPWGGRDNLALNQPASQVSTVHGGDASRAVDGDTSTDYFNNGCTHTNFANDAWWRVDLGSPFPVAEVVIVNRQCVGGCADYMKSFEIRIGNSTTGADSSNQICGSSLQVATGQRKSFRCVSTIRGRYVYIIIPGNNKVLTICEVEVYPTISSSCHHVSSNKSFLFSLYNINGYAPVKLKIKSSGYSEAIYTCSAGPTFGGGADLYISNNAASNQASYTSCGYSYPLPPRYSASRSSCRFYAGGQSYKFTPSDIEVFYETTT